MVKFRRGDRVYYAVNKYGKSKRNPLKGTELECAGTIVEPGLRSCRVDWDNGEHNTYNPGTLEHSDSTKDPNWAFIKNKRVKGKYLCAYCKTRTNILPSDERCKRCGKSAWQIKN